MSIRRLAAGTALAACMTWAMAVPASAAPQPTAAFTGGVVSAAGGEATVTFTYTCSSTDSPANHLFVAVKQGPRVNTTDRSSSGSAKTFYSTNWMSDEGPNALNCDGASHQQTVVLKPDVYWPGSASAPPLRSGPALVQICVFDNVTGEDPDTHEPIGGFGMSYTMERVLAKGGRS